MNGAYVKVLINDAIRRKKVRDEMNHEFAWVVFRLGNKVYRNSDGEELQIYYVKMCMIT